MVSAIEVAGRLIGPGHACFIIAEIGVNHDGDLERARLLIDAAARAGADAVKFQTFSADRLVVSDAPKAGYQLRGTPEDETQLEMLRRLELPLQAYRQLIEHGCERKVLFMSTPFDEGSADFLDDLGVPVFKIPSGEITNLLFLAHVARKGKPMIISTGMSTLGEVETAVRTVEDAGNHQLVLLHCVSNYPALEADVNLRAMSTMARTFKVPVGYSDHTLGIAVELAAVAMGACVIEKHLTLDRSSPGPDHRASLEPQEFAALIDGIRRVESALGDGVKRPAPTEAAIVSVVRKSLVAATDIPAGSRVTAEMLAVKRPGTGLPPSMRGLVVGRCAKQDIRAGMVLTMDMIA